MLEGFLQSFVPIRKPIKKALKKYRVEAFLIGASLIVAVFSFFTYQQAARVVVTDSARPDIQEKRKVPTIIYVDLSGAVEKPDVYGVTPGARLKDVLTLAGGLSQGADRSFFARNFNLARLIQDQEKIYIPSMQEINAGIFTEK